MDSFVSCNEMEQHGTIIAIWGEGGETLWVGGGRNQTGQLFFLFCSVTMLEDNTSTLNIASKMERLFHRAPT